MGKVIGPPLKQSDQDWINLQHVFFHATAPLSSHHRVNVSPKSSQQFRVINDSTVSWLDYSGSGSETAAHLIENGRMTIMFVAFEGSPRIMRLYGRGEFVLPNEVDKNEALRDAYKGELEGGNDYDNGFRCIVILHLDRVSQSCGYSIPKFLYQSERKTLKEFSSSKGLVGMQDYRYLKNSFSIDGLPSIGQLLKKEWPTSITSVDGYYFAHYDEGKSLWKKLSCYLQACWIRRNLSVTSRDGLFVLLGISIGIVLTPWIRPNIRR